MCFLFDDGKDFQERPYLASRYPSAHGALELREAPVHAARNRPPLRCQRDDEGAAIGGADCARDQAAVGQPIEDARQRRALVRQAGVQLRDRRRRRRGKVRKDVRFALGKAVLAQVSEIQPDPVRRAVDWWNQA